MALLRQTLVASLLLAISAVAVFADGNADVVETFLKAADQTDIRSPGSPAFELDAKLKLFLQGNVIPGTYQLMWVSPEKWREEINLPGYQRIEVLGEQSLNWYRNLDHEILAIGDLDDALNFAWRLRRAAKGAPGKLNRRVQSGVQMDCSRFQGYENEDFCFESQEGTLDAELFPQGRVVSPEVASRQYSDFVPFGEKRFPRTIRILRDQQPLLEISVDQLVPLDTSAVSKFTVPPGAQLWPTCSAPDPPKLVKSVNPEYPQIERTAHRSTQVILNGEIEVDGSVNNVRVVYPTAEDFNVAAVAAVRRWQYRPANCNGTPVPTNIFIKVVFVLGP